jgi:uncharacterized alkaline shock family protein YloU
MFEHVFFSEPSQSKRQIKKWLFACEKVDVACIKVHVAGIKVDVSKTQSSRTMEHTPQKIRLGKFLPNS